MLRAVIDTQILLRAAVKQTTLAGKMVREYLPLYKFVYSLETKAELKDVLHRPKTRRKFADLTDQIVSDFFAVIERGLLVTLDHPIPQIARDPKDDIFLATALVGEADYLVTQDKDLLVLATYRKTQIVELPAFWEVLQSLG